MDELTTSRIEGNKFYLGQAELSFIVKRIIKHYQYRHNNEDPKAVIIPYLEEVEGVPILYMPTITIETTTTPSGGENLATHRYLDVASKAVEPAAKAKKVIQLKPEEA